MRITFSQALTIIALALVVAIVPACGGGGGSSGNASGSPTPPPVGPTPSVGHIHVGLTNTNKVIFPFAATSNIDLASTQFTPTNPTDMILYARVEIAYSYGAVAPATFTLTVSSPYGIVAQGSAQLQSGPSQFMSLTVSLAGVSQTSMLGAFASSSAYTLDLSVSGIPQASNGVFDSATFAVVALEGITTSNPSPQMN